MSAKFVRSSHPQRQRRSSIGQALAACAAGALAASLALPVQAQATFGDSAFLACARYTDRGQRIACLEDALEAATAQTGVAPASTPVAPAAAAPATAQPAAPVAPVTPAAPATATTTEAAPAEERSLLDRVRAFGRSDSVKISTDESGQDRLHDSITTLDKRNNLWIVTLSSGQVWRQTYPRTLLLREGDEIEIYREGIGNAYRLATPRLSGFIRVERVE